MPLPCLGILAFFASSFFSLRCHRRIWRYLPAWFGPPIIAFLLLQRKHHMLFPLMSLLQYNGAVEKGTYALLLALEKEARFAAGRLGTFTFPAGYYIYLGSARGGLHTRVKRHLKGEKRLRWHIDFLLEHAEVVEVWYALGDEPQECLWCQVAREMPQSDIPVLGFGSSDCRCPSHLIHFFFRPLFHLFQRSLGAQGRMLKRSSPQEFLS